MNMYILSRHGENNLRYESEDITITEDGDIIIDGIECKCDVANSTDDDKFDIFVSYIDYQRILGSKPKDSTEEFFVSQTIDLTPIRNKEKYPGMTLWVKDGFCYFQHEITDSTKKEIIKVNYSRIWSVLEKKYNLDFFKIEGLLGKLLTKYFGYGKVKVLCGYTTISDHVINEFLHVVPIEDVAIPEKTTRSLDSLEESFILNTLGLYKRTEKKYPTSTFWFLDKTSMLEYREPDGFFRFRYSMWKKLGEDPSINGDYHKMVSATKKLVKKYFGYENIITTYNSDDIFDSIDKHFEAMDTNNSKIKKLEDIIDEAISDMDRFEDETNYPGRIFFFNDHNCIMEYNSSNDYLYMSFNVFWTKFLDIYGNNILEMTNSVAGLCKNKLDIIGDYKVIAKVQPWDKVIDDKYELYLLSKNTVPSSTGRQMIVDAFESVKYMKKFENKQKFPDRVYWFKNDKCIMALMTDYNTLCIDDVFFKTMTDGDTVPYIIMKDLVKEEAIKIIDPNIKNVITIQGAGWLSVEKYFIGGTGTTIEERFDELFVSIISDIVHKHDEKKFKGKDFWFKGKKCIIFYNSNQRCLYFRYPDMWVIFEKNLGLNYEKVRNMMLKMAEKHFGLVNVTIGSYSSEVFVESEKHFFGINDDDVLYQEVKQFMDGLKQTSLYTGNPPVLIWSVGVLSKLLYIINDRELCIQKSTYDRMFLNSRIVDESNFKKKLKEILYSLPGITTIKKINPVENIDKFYKELQYNYRFMEHVDEITKNMAIKTDDVNYPNKVFWFNHIKKIFLFGIDIVEKYVIVNYPGFVHGFKTDGPVEEKFMNKSIKKIIEEELMLEKPLPNKIHRCPLNDIGKTIPKEDTILFTYNGEYVTKLEQFFGQ